MEAYGIRIQNMGSRGCRFAICDKAGRNIEAPNAVYPTRNAAMAAFWEKARNDRAADGCQEG